MNVFVVGRIQETDDNTDFVVFGTFLDKEDAKQFIFAHSALVMGADSAPIGLWKFNTERELMRTYNSDDLAKYYNKQVAERSVRMATGIHSGVDNADDGALKAINYTGNHKVKVLKQLANQVASYEKAIATLSSRPDLQASLQKQLDALNDAIEAIKLA